MATLKIELEGRDQIITFDDEYSFQDFTNTDMSGENLNGKMIYSSVFYHETPDVQTFNPAMTGVTFIKCNLDNIDIPDGNTLIECSQRRFKAQDDGQDWIINEENQPIDPLTAGGT